MVLVLVIQIVCGAIWLIAYAAIVAEGDQSQVRDYIDGLETNGLFVSVALLTSSVAALAFVWLIIHVRRWSVFDYVCLGNVKWETAIKWSIGALAMGAAFDLLAMWIGDDTGMEFMMTMVRTAGFLPLLTWLS